MIIKIKQTASNIKQLFDIEGDDFTAYGELGNLNKFQDITLSYKTTIINGEFVFSKPANYIPLRYLFKKTNTVRNFVLYKDGEEYGNIVNSIEGFYKSRHIITLNNGNTFYCYSRFKGRFGYISIYQSDKQIALVETFLTTTDFKFNHKLYILDEYNSFADVLTFFVLYYSNFNYSERFHMSKYTNYSSSYSFSFYNKKFDPKWRENHFPNENFFGKINI
ncbi:MAG: hypothetical protein J6B80_02065 [Clostridia bacterium]|nr:hypothetical protein [Clostridia bacterium]